MNVVREVQKASHQVCSKPFIASDADESKRFKRQALEVLALAR